MNLQKLPFGMVKLLGVQVTLWEAISKRAAKTWVLWSIEDLLCLSTPTSTFKARHNLSDLLFTAKFSHFSVKKSCMRSKIQRCNKSPTY